MRYNPATGKRIRKKKVQQDKAGPAVDEMVQLLDENDELELEELSSSPSISSQSAQSDIPVQNIAAVRARKDSCYERICQCMAQLFCSGVSLNIHAILTAEANQLGYVL